MKAKQQYIIEIYTKARKLAYPDWQGKVQIDNRLYNIYDGQGKLMNWMSEEKMLLASSNFLNKYLEKKI